MGLVVNISIAFTVLCLIFMLIADWPQTRWVFCPEREPCKKWYFAFFYLVVKKCIGLFSNEMILKSSIENLMSVWSSLVVVVEGSDVINSELILHVCRVCVGQRRSKYH